MSTKRSASSAFGSLSVYTYQNPLAALFFPCTEGSNRSLVEPVLAAVFGPPCTSMFSLTSSSDGNFILADHAACGERLRLPSAPPSGERTRAPYRRASQPLRPCRPP